MTRALLRLYALLLRLLPRALRERIGREMYATVAARLAAAPSPAWRVLAFLHEAAGLVRVAIVTAVPARRHGGHVARGGRMAPGGDDRAAGAVDVVVQELRFAGRALRRRPGMALLALLTLALGIGSSTAMFSVIDGVLLRPLPFEQPERIVFVSPTIEEWREHPTLSAQWRHGRFSGPELHAWRERQRAFEAVAGYTETTARVPSGGGAEHVGVVLATPELFRVLRARPLLGRFPDDADLDGEPVAVVSYGFWQRHLGGEAGAVGGDVTLNESPVRVIGVLPPHFELPGVTAEVWRPFRPSATEGLSVHTLKGIARLRTGVTRAEAEAETGSILRAVAAAEDAHLTHGAHIEHPLEVTTAAVRTPLLVLLGASLLLLAAACASVALLLLGAGADRVRELAVRGALGASRLRIARQLVVESLLLSVAASVLGLLLARGFVRLLLLLAPADMPRLAVVAVDARAFAFAALLAVGTGVVVGALPALSLSRVRGADALRAGATSVGHGRLQRAVVVLELALATVLLLGAGLLTRTLAELQRVRPGFDPDGLVTVQLGLPIDRLRAGVDSWDSVGPLVNTQIERLRDALAAVPGVTAVAAPSHLPFSGDRGTTEVEAAGYEPADGEIIDVAFRFVTANYLQMLRVTPLHGRLFTPADDQPTAERVMIVNDRFARRFWPDGDWLDRTVSFWGNAYRVVGVVPDMREQDLRGDADALKFYVPVRGRFWGAFSPGNFMVRSTRPAAELMPELRAAIWNVDDTIVIRRMASMRERISGSVADYRYRARLMAVFALLAGTFALLGIHGVVNRSVVRRRRELGVRIALGARQADIVADVVADGCRTAAFGVVLGAAVALAATRLLESMIWGVPRTDTPTFVAIALTLLVLSAAASLYPALRAAAVQPMSIIRGD